MLNYGLTWKIMGQNRLLHWQKDTSSFLKIELDRVSNETGFIDNVRGYGTHLAFDCANEELADIMVKTNKGPDFITVDGGEGGTGAAPPSFADHVSLPWVYGFSDLYKLLSSVGVASIILVLNNLVQH